MRVGFFPCLLFILILNGCTDSGEQSQPNVYYDVAGFVKRQITTLSVQKPPVSKAVLINKKRSLQATQNVNWSRELELFTQADINKPALRSSYRIIRPDSLTYQYTLKKAEERLTVRSLRVQLDSLTHQPRRIEAVLQTNNPLYSSERQLLLESSASGRSSWRIQHYKVSGFQKLPYFSKNNFVVEGQVH